MLRKVKEVSVTVAGLQTEIWTRDLQNTKCVNLWNPTTSMLAMMEDVIWLYGVERLTGTRLVGLWWLWTKRD